MRPTLRRYRDESDFWRIRNFLRDVMLANDLRAWSWPVSRLDYWRWHVTDCIGLRAINEMIFIWETPAGEIAAVVNIEGFGEAHLHVHPTHATRELEADMLDTAEKYLSHGAPRRLTVFADATQHAQRVDLLQQRGYVRGDWPEHQWRRDLDTPIPDAPQPDGYTFRALGPAEEIPARSWCSWRAFHPDEPDDKYDGHSWYAPNIQHEPLYRRDLDLIAVPDTSSFTIAAFVTVWFDDVTRTAYFEPVGTDPAHQRRGLARALLTEGLRRVQALGCQRAFVGGYSAAANALYRSVFSQAHDLSVPWTRTW